LWRAGTLRVVATVAARQYGGPGWLAFGLFAFGEAAIGQSLIGGYEQAVFVAVLGTAIAFEIVWYSLHHANAVAPPR
jgi:hypothetical protein